MVMAIRVLSGIAALVAALVAGGALAGCTGVGESAIAADPQSSSSASVSPSQAQSSGSVAPQEPSESEATSSDPATGDEEDGSITVSGSVESGVELNCLVLLTGETTYLLVGGDRTELVVGTTVTVRGYVKPDLMTTCQQGTPLEVEEIQTS